MTGSAPGTPPAGEPFGRDRHSRLPWLIPALSGLAIAGYVLLAMAQSEYRQYQAQSKWERHASAHGLAERSDDVRELRRSPRLEMPGSWRWRLSTALVRLSSVPGASMLPRSPSPGEPVARLRIPAIDLDYVVLEGTGAELLSAPGHYRFSVLPGLPDNSVISGHRDRHFRRLGELKTGDEVVTETAHGTFRWRIAKRMIVDAKDPAVIRRAPGPRLTLTTCYPVRFMGPAPQRLVLEANPAEWSTGM